MNRTAVVVLVTTSFPIRGDGSEAAGSFVFDLVGELARRISVRVVAPGIASGYERWSEHIEVYRYAAPQAPLSVLKLWRPRDAAAIRRVLRAGSAATRQAVAAGSAVHILAMWALPSGAWARRTAAEYGLRYSIWTLGSDIWSLGRLPGVRGYLRRVLRGAQALYADGIQLASDAHAICGREVNFLPSTRSIERSRTEPPRPVAPYRLLFLGRWHPNKGVDLLLDALNLLGDADWNRIEHVEICGGGPLEMLVRDKIRALQAAGRPLALHGFLDKAEAEAAILRADYLLIPSRIESIPVVFSDAMKLGTAVIAMPVGDLRGLIETAPRCGIAADTVSAKAFADALSRALHDKASAFAAGTRVRACQFDLHRVADRIIADCAGLASD